MSRTIYPIVLFSGLVWATATLPVQGSPDADLPALTLGAAEDIARRSDPLVSRFQRLAEARRQGAVADGQLPDPKLKFALANFPTDTFNRTEEPMTQIKVGVIQSFPRGNTLAYREQRTLALGDAEQARSEDQALKTLRSTREAWLEVYFQVQAGRIVEASREFFVQLVGITEAQYGAGRSNQQDVLQAGLELSRLDDRQTRIQTAEDTARAELAKWVGEPALQPLPEDLPELPGVRAIGDLEAGIPGHPSIAVENARVAANRMSERVAREQYKPGWSVDVTYGQRGGNNPDGDDRPDFLSAMVVMDMPLFTGQRQDRRLAASEQERLAATHARDDRLRELRRMLHSEYARWRRLGERVALYDKRLIPEAGANVEAALLAYQSRVTEFITLMRARITDLDTRLQALRLRVDRAKAQARLLYVAGEKS